MKVGILTLPPQNNYGGAMQAYALVRVLSDMGHDAKLIMPRIRFFKLNPIYAPFVYLKRAFKRYVLGDKSVILLVEQQLIKEYYIIHQNYIKFLDDNIKQYPCKGYRDIPSDMFDCIVVGSDQVWRQKYRCDTLINRYLDFARDWDIKRYAYSASFGVEDMDEYSHEQVTQCAELIKLFDAVSVREDSAVDLCCEYFGVDAEHLLDPTMLFDKQHYIELIKDYPKQEGKIFGYILFEGDNYESITKRCSEKLNIDKISLVLAGSFVSIALRKPIFSPYKWLANFRDADFVVTDSFHGMVFSIIFNKPFVVILNHERSPTRLTSLLKIFGLEDRIIYINDELQEHHFAGIDWSKVNEIKKEYQEKSLNFIKKNIY